MGRWMEVVRERLPEDQRDYDLDCKHQVVAEAAPYPIMWAAGAIQAASRRGWKPIEQFPMLNRVREHSPCYVDENLWLPPDEAPRLLEEFVRLRRICRREEFVTGLDGYAAAMAWRKIWSMSEFESYLDSNERVLRQAVEGSWWVRLML